MPVPLVFRIRSMGADLPDLPQGPTAGGNVVEIYGDNFQLPPAAPTTNVSTGSEDNPPTVEVLFNGVASPRVEVVRSNCLRAIAPGSPLQAITAAGLVSPEGLVSITVRNIDGTGVLIPTEEIILADAYTYTRAGLTAADVGTVAYIDQEFMLRWIRDTIDNVSKGSHTEWDPSTADDLNIIAIAEMPAIVLVGPDLPENSFYSVRELQELDLGDGTVALVAPPRTVDFTYDVILIADNEAQMMALVQLVTDFVKQTSKFTIDRCPDDLALGTITYELEQVSALTRQSRPNNSNVRSYTTTVVLRGIDIDRAPGFGALVPRAETAVPVLGTAPQLDADTFEV